MNLVALSGRLTADPDFKKGTKNKKAVARFRLAVDRPGQDTADFVSVVVFGRLAEVIAEYASKGKPVSLEGRLAQSSWTTDEGASRSRLEIIAHRVQLLRRAG